MTRSAHWTAVAAAAALIAGSLTTPAAQSPIARFSALSVSLGAGAGQTSLPIDIQIARWSTEAERDRVMATLLEQGPAKLLEVLRQMPAVGRLSTPGVTGHELRYAVETRSGGTQRVLILTDRPVWGWEVGSGDRTLDYPFTVIELRVGPSGQGDGTIAVAAKIAVDKRTKAISFEDYNISPVLLKGLKRER